MATAPRWPRIPLTETVYERWTSPALTLVDWRIRVSDLYAQVRADDDPNAATRPGARAATSCSARIRSQPLPPDDPLRDTGLPYWPYDPAWRFTLPLQPADPDERELDTGDDGGLVMRRIASVELPVGGSLDVWTMHQYAGGLFVPIKDGTSGFGVLRSRSLPAGHREELPGSVATRRASCSTSTSPTTRPAATTTAGAARSPLPATPSTCAWRPASGCRERQRRRADAAAARTASVKRASSGESSRQRCHIELDVDVVTLAEHDEPTRFEVRQQLRLGDRRPAEPLRTASWKIGGRRHPMHHGWLGRHRGDGGRCAAMSSFSLNTTTGMPTQSMPRLPRQRSAKAGLAAGM